ncbi:MAG: hypothetical protein H6685_00555 [Deltaproteobacteria bacterium]|nr:hypothetical protein [Deltaproteobacteria bacterium]
MNAQDPGIDSRTLLELIKDHIRSRPGSECHIGPNFSDEVEKAHRRLNQKLGADIPKKRIGLGRGEGVEWFYDPRIIEPLADAIYARLYEGKKPQEIQANLLGDLAKAGIIPDGGAYLQQYVYNRGAIEILNETAEVPDELLASFNRILRVRNREDFEFEWSIKRIRTNCVLNRPNPPRSSKWSRKKYGGILGCGLEIFCDRPMSANDGLPGHFFDMEVTQDIVQDFHAKRLRARELFQKTLFGDRDAELLLEKEAYRVAGQSSEPWLSSWSFLSNTVSPSGYDWGTMLCRRPPDLVDYAYLRAWWISNGLTRPLKDALPEWFFVCANEKCRNLEHPFRVDRTLNKRCRHCRPQKTSQKIPSKKNVAKKKRG